MKAALNVGGNTPANSGSRVTKETNDLIKQHKAMKIKTRKSWQH